MLKKSLPVVLLLGLVMLALPLTAMAQELPPEAAPRFGMLAEGEPGGRGMRGFRFRGGGINPVEATAQVTGQAPADVIAALQDGQTFADVAEGAGVTLQAIADVIMAARAEALAQAVTEGRFTPEQADAMLEQMSEHLLDRLNAPWEPRHAGNGYALEGAQPRNGMGFRGGNAQGRGMMRGADAANCPNAQP